MKIQPTIISFGVQFSDAMTLSGIASHYGIILKNAKADEYSETLGNLAIGRKSVRNAGKANPKLSEAILVFCCIDNSTFDKILQDLSQSKRLSGVLKAVLTPTNSTWNVYMLLKEVVKERQAYTAMERSNA